MSGKTSGPDREPAEAVMAEARAATRNVDALTAALPFDDDPHSFQAVLEELAPDEAGDGDE